MRGLLVAVLPLVSSTLLAALPPCETSGIPEGSIPSGEQLFLELPAVPSRRYVITAATPGPCLGPPSHCHTRNAEAFVLEPEDDPFVMLFTPRTSDDRIYRVTILGTSAGPGDPVLQCQTRVDIPLRAHAPLASVADRVVVPAGSASGMNGSEFRTALRLTGFGAGTIFFRKAGSFHGDERDPSIRYDLGFIPFSGIPATVHFDDIAASLGVTGLGMLDVVPDEILEDPRGGFIAPHVQSWIYNESGEGRNGTVVGAIPPAVLARATLHMIVPADYPSGSRVNVGYRTFDKPARLILGVLARTLDSIIVFNDFEVPENTFHQVPLDSLVPADLILLEPGDIVLLIEEGEDAAVAAYYSVTNNRSNDTAVFYEPEHWEPDRLGDVIVRFPDWY